MSADGVGVDGRMTVPMGPDRSDAPPDPCDPEIFKHGAVICTFHAGSRQTEGWVRQVRAESGQRVDWHYSGGMANVLFIGDYVKVRAAIEKLGPLPGAELFRILPPESRGLYRQGDELPPGTVGVVTT